MSKLRLVRLATDLFLVLLAIILLNAFRSTDIYIEDQFIPTMINGVTACTSLIAGFTMTAIAITISQFKDPRDAFRIATLVLLFLLTIMILLLAYALQIKADYQEALRVSMYSLAISLILSFDFAFFLYTKLHTFEQEHK